jgi:replicative DNA helicase
MMRSLASLSRVDQTRIRTGQLDDEDWARISGTMGSCWKSAISILMTPPA